MPDTPCPPPLLRSIVPGVPLVTASSTRLTHFASSTMQVAA
ncbi:hypothetical protein [Rhodoplanes sp.]|nr:hypothetical protein [Rhodoplanes sp.]